VGQDKESLTEQQRKETLTTTILIRRIYNNNTDNKNTDNKNIQKQGNTESNSPPKARHAPQQRLPSP